MKIFCRLLILIMSGLWLIACVSTSPASSSKQALPPPEKIAIATNIQNEPVVSLLGTTIFENKLTHIADFDFDLRQFILHQTDSLIGTIGLQTVINEQDISLDLYYDLNSNNKSRRMAAAESLRKDGAEALLLITQGRTYQGLQYGRGALLDDHGLFLVRTIIGSRDYIVLPVDFNYYDLRTGKRISRVYDSDNLFYATRVDYLKHIDVAEDVNDLDKAALIDEYKSKYLRLLMNAVSRIRF